MSLIGGWRFSSASSGSTFRTDSIMTFVGFPASGLTNSNIIGVCCFDYNYNTQKWIPKSH